MCVGGAGQRWGRRAGPPWAPPPRAHCSPLAGTTRCPHHMHTHTYALPANTRLPPPLQLLVEVVQQLQRMFTPDVKVIKRAIDSLIDVS